MPRTARVLTLLFLLFLHLSSLQSAARADERLLLPTAAGTTVAHPRIWLDGATLATVRQRAAANSPAWTALKAQCDAYLTGSVEWPDGNDYPDGGGIGEGYQGSGYVAPLLNLGLCCQVERSLEPSRAPLYAQKGVDVLVHMSEPSGSHAPPPLRDDGYGIRNYGLAMAIGYDWLYPALTTAQRARVYQALNAWIAAFESGGFERDHPQGNYFAGYYAAKGLAALATEGDNPSAPTQWQDWLTRLHGQMVQPYYAQYLAGGGWPEGWNYGPLGTLNMVYPILAARTAKGLDLTTGGAPFRFPVDQALNLIHFTWPDRRTLDDRGTLYAGDNPSEVRSWLYTPLAGMLPGWQAASAPVFHRFARGVRAVSHDPAELWQELLFWDDAAPEAPVEGLPLSYLATGTNMAAVRSSWSAGATWASFTAAPYLNYSGAGHEYFDQGGLAIVRGDLPLLVNTTGALMRNMPGTNGGDSFESAIYDDLFGDNDADPSLENRTLFNVFYVRARHYGQEANGPDTARTSLSRFEEGGSYVLLRGSHLEDMYRPDPATGVNPVTSWTRDVLYLRPGLFVLYDRTTTAGASADQWMAFHLPRVPTEVIPAPSNATHRFDVTTPRGYAGAVTTLLPRRGETRLVNVFGSGKVYRLEVRPPSPGASQQWLTVFDTASSPSAAAVVRRLSSTDGNVTSGNVLGAYLQQASASSVVLAGAGGAGQTVTGPVQYVVPARAAHHLLTDLQPGQAYSVAVTVAGGNHTVHVAAGAGGLRASAAGALSFTVDAAGRVSAG